MPRRGERKSRPGGSLDPYGLAALVEGFYHSMRVKNYSEATIQSRRVHFNLFFAWCQERGISRASEVTRAILERYQRYLYHYRKQRGGGPLTFGSQHARLVPVRAFFRYLAKANLILHNPAAELELPKLEKRLPKHILTAGEADQVMNQCDLEDTVGLRDRAILETFYSTGMRRMELANLAVYHLDMERGTLVVRKGKWKRDRVIPIGDRALAWIEKYLAEARPRLVVEPDPGNLFLTGMGQPLTPNRLTQMVGDYVRKAGTPKKGSCHLFRHTMATLMLEGGADVRFIQEMLGHAKLDTTQIYTQVSIRKLKEVHAGTHPAAKLERWKKADDDSADEAPSLAAEAAKDEKDQ